MERSPEHPARIVEGRIVAAPCVDADPVEPPQGGRGGKAVERPREHGEHVPVKAVG